MEARLQANIWKYAIYLTTHIRTLAPIQGAYYLTIPDVTAASIGLILLLSNLIGFFVEMPSGYISDKIGHKSALVFSKVLICISTTFFLFATSLTLLILGGVFMSIARAFHSGTGSAFMHETLEGLGREKEYARIMGKVSAIGLAAPIMLTMLLPFLVEFSFRIPFAVVLCFDLIGLLVALAFAVPPVPQEEIDEVKLTNFRGVMREGYNRNFFIFALFSGIILGVFFAVGSFRAPYQMLLGVPIIWFGVLFGVARVGASLMLAYSGWIHDRVTLFGLMTFQLVAYAALLIGLGLTTEPWVVVTLFMIIGVLAQGLYKVENTFFLDILKGSKFKATLLSIQSQIKELTLAVVGFGIGFAIEYTTYQFGFLLTGFAYIGLLLPMYIYILRTHKKVNEAVSRKHNTN